MTDELRDIPGIDGYAVTRDGRVWSKPRSVARAPTATSIAGRWLKASASVHGYFVVNIHRANVAIRRLVALAWLPASPAGYRVVQCDGDLRNHHADNLQWMSCRDLRMTRADRQHDSRPPRRPAVLSDAARERATLLKIRRHMIARCTDPKNVAFHYYGGRGITVCERWLESPSAFVDDVSPRPAGMTLDRIDNDGPYAPGNVRWASMAQQMRNRRGNVIVSVDGERMILKDACARLSVSYDAACSRVRRGENPQSVLSILQSKGAVNV